MTAYTKPSTNYIATAFTGVLNSSTPAAVTVSGLTNGITYYLAVTAHNTIGTSLSSPYSVGVNPSADAPERITDLSVVGKSRSATLDFTLPYNGGSIIQYYDVHVQYTSAFERKEIYGRPSTLANIPAGTVTFKVRAYNGKYASYSNEVTVTINS